MESETQNNKAMHGQQIKTSIDCHGQQVSLSCTVELRYDRMAA